MNIVEIIIITFIVVNIYFVLYNYTSSSGITVKMFALIFAILFIVFIGTSIIDIEIILDDDDKIKNLYIYLILGFVMIVGIITTIYIFNHNTYVSILSFLTNIFSGTPDADHIYKNKVYFIIMFLWYIIARITAIIIDKIKNKLIYIMSSYVDLNTDLQNTLNLMEQSINEKLVHFTNCSNDILAAAHLNEDTEHYSLVEDQMSEEQVDTQKIIVGKFPNDTERAVICEKSATYFSKKLELILKMKKLVGLVYNIIVAMYSKNICNEFRMKVSEFKNNPNVSLNYKCTVAGFFDSSLDTLINNIADDFVKQSKVLLNIINTNRTLIVETIDLNELQKLDEVINEHLNLMVTTAENYYLNAISIMKFDTNNLIFTEL